MMAVLQFDAALAGKILGWTGLTLLVLFALFSFPALGYILYAIHLKRDRKKKKWGRECSSDDPIQQTMYREGMAWKEAHTKNLVALHQVREGLHLYAEYMDLGYRRAVIIVPGRTEGLEYGYYFAKAYADAGYNVLTIDQRAHGKSDGRYNTIGFEESKDVVAWAEQLHDRFGVRHILLHGICIGSSCTLLALTSEHCPSYIEGMVAEGMYSTFYESFKNHMIALKKPVFPALPLVNFWFWQQTGYTMKKGPIHRIAQLNKPILMLHGKEDLYSLPEQAQQLYDACGSERKTLIWFEHGVHSQLRFADTRQYDTAITAFLEKNFAETRETV